MRAIFLQLSSLLGLIVFLSHLWRSADIGRTVFMAVGVGLAIYVVLVLSYAAIHRIIRQAPKDTTGPAAPTPPPASPETAPAEPAQAAA